MNGKSSGFISGAAGGASMGSSFGPWGTAIGAIGGGLIGLASGAQKDASQQSQTAWANYNSQSQYNITMSNIAAQSAITAFNAGMVMRNAEQQVGMSNEIARYNADLIGTTMEYNDSLLEEDISAVWENMELDLTQLAQQRVVERGAIVAQQASSGTVIGDGSNADVIVNSMTQEAMDTLIVRRGADRQVRDINNARAKGRWEGTVAIQQALWNGEIASYTTMSNAKTQAAGMMVENSIASKAGKLSAGYALSSGMAGISQSNSQYSAQNTNNMMSNLFSSAGSAASSYYRSKAIFPESGGSSYSVASKTNYQRALAGSPSWERGLSTPGTSLAT